jgi:hypothetical protein
MDSKPIEQEYKGFRICGAAYSVANGVDRWFPSVKCCSINTINPCFWSTQISEGDSTRELAITIRKRMPRKV